MPTMLDEDAIPRILTSLLAALLQTQPANLPTAWHDDTRRSAACAKAISAFFHLHDAGMHNRPMQNRLLNQATLAGWAGIVADALTAGTTGITVHTSGSTGAPCPCTHAWDRLAQETGHWASLMADRRRVVSFVPPHHLYGLMFAALLPARLGIPTLDARALPPGHIAGLLRDTDLVVATPPLLTALAAAATALPERLVLVSAGAPLRWDIADALFEAGATVHDVYGSSETGGIAVRTHPATWHRLLPFWRGGQGGCSASVVRDDGAALALPDRVVWTGPDTLRLDGRKDAAVRINGADVYPARIAACIMQHPMVAECTVRLDTTLPFPRLKAAVVPRHGAPSDTSRLVATLEAFCRERFTGAERPVRIDVMPALPRSIHGKPRDWGQAA